MTELFPCPPVPELARAKGNSVAELRDWFFDYFDRGSVFFNYRTGTVAVRAAYQGVHNLSTLRAAISRERTAVGRKSNDQVIQLAAPFSFGRSTQVFDLSPRRFTFGRERHSTYRVPFMFVEGGVIKAYFLQPRKSAGLSIDEFGMVAAIIKSHLLDQEFFGQTTNIEIVDVSAPPASNERVARFLTLDDVPLWSSERLGERLTMISAALDAVQTSGYVVRKPAQRPQPTAPMPLFD